MPNSPAAVSILLPYRDAAPWLDETLSDLRAQTVSGLEVLAVDDASRDGGEKIVARHAAVDSRIRALRGAGRGAAAALNQALQAARGALVGHMEADDRCPPRRFERLRAALLEHPDWDAATSQAEIFGAVTDGMQRYMQWQNSLLSSEQMERARFIEIPALHQTGLYRRSCLDRLEGWREPDEWPLDIDFWMRFFDRGFRVGKLPEPLYRWRQHRGQSTRTSSRHRLENLRRCKARFLTQGPARGQQIALCSRGQTLGAWAQALRDEGAQVTEHDLRPGAHFDRPSGSLGLFAFGSARARQRVLASGAFDEGRDWFVA